MRVVITFVAAMAANETDIDEANNLLVQGSLEGRRRMIFQGLDQGATFLEDNESYTLESRKLLVLLRRIRDRPLDEKGILAIAAYSLPFIDTVAKFAMTNGVPLRTIKKLLCVDTHRQFRMRWAHDRGPLIRGIRTIRPHVQNPLQALVAQLPRAAVAEITLQLARTQPTFYFR